MSRIIKNIIETVWPTNNTTYLLFHCNNPLDIELVKNIDGTVYAFNKNDADLNNRLIIITDQELSNNLLICPRFVLNTCLPQYQQANQLAQMLRTPLINYIFNADNIKKEGAFALASEIEQSINIFNNKEIPAKLFLSNYHIANIHEVNQIIQQEISQWKKT